MMNLRLHSIKFNSFGKLTLALGCIFYLSASAPLAAQDVDKDGSTNNIFEMGFHCVTGNGGPISSPFMGFEATDDMGDVDGWGLRASKEFFAIDEQSCFETSGALGILQVREGAPTNSIRMTDTGIGVLALVPEAPFHVQTADDAPFGAEAEIVRIEDASSTTAVRNLLTLKNNGGARFALANAATGKRWIISTDSNDTLFWTEANSPDANTAPYFRMFLNGTSSTILAQMGHLGQSQARFSFLRNGNLNMIGNLNEGSDRNNKEHFSTVDPMEILAKVCELPISTWNYKHDDDSIRHIGPMAQDFRAAFGLGVNDVSIAGIDKDGVAIAAIQGLHKIVQEKDEKINQLEAQLKAQTEDQNFRIEQLEKAMSQLLQQQN